MKILIAEDDTSSRVYLERALISQGYSVESASNGRKALEKIEQSPPDLIISDIMMPEMDGFELCRRLKSDERLRAIPFVFYTATFIEQKDEQLAMTLGASRFLVKPMDPEDLLKTIRGVIEEHSKTGLQVPDQSLTDMAALDRMQIEVLARKLDKKVRELEAQREALRTSEQKYRKLYESMMDGFVLVGIDGMIQDCNETYRAMLGYTKEELKQLTYGDITTEQWRAYEEKIIQEQILVRGYSDIYEKEYRKKNGDVFRVELHSFLLKNERDEPEGIWAIVRDLTEKRRLEEQLRQAQKMEAVGQLAGGVAHDFNNIITAIVGFGHLALMKMKEDDPLRENMDQILAASKRATFLTQSLLAFSRKQVVNPLPVDLNETVKQVQRFLRRLIGEDVTIAIQAASEAMWVKADHGQIEQILMNLSTNARDAMPKGGLLSIEVSRIELTDQFISHHGYGKPGPYALLSVSDTGMGMDEERKTKIFDPFFTTKEDGKGTGLGLSIVYGIIKQHDGYINVYSEPGKGTTFRIYLPLIDASGVTAQPTEVLAPARGTETVLLAEDDETVRNMNKMVLEQFGYQVIAASNGEQAVEKFIKNKDRVNLVILDVIMPKKNGKEAYNDIRKVAPEVRTLFTSGYTAEIIRKNEILEEGLSFLSKPVSPMVFLQKVRETLDHA